MRSPIHWIWTKDCEGFWLQLIEFMRSIMDNQQPYQRFGRRSGRDTQLEVGIQSVKNKKKTMKMWGELEAKFNDVCKQRVVLSSKLTKTRANFTICLWRWSCPTLQVCDIFVCQESSAMMNMIPRFSLISLDCHSTRCIPKHVNGTTVFKGTCKNHSTQCSGKV